MYRSCSTSSYFILSFLIINHSKSIIGKIIPYTNSLPYEILSLDLATKLHFDQDSLSKAAKDFGNILQKYPSAVLKPTSIYDIVNLIRFSYNSSIPFCIAARGHGHSIRGQAMAQNGVVVDMSSLSQNNNIRVSWSNELGFYADVGAEQLWIDVLNATLDHGLSPVSWTDYLYLTVGGTLSNAGISGQTFRYGPQISNVHELDVITGKGKLVTCSKLMNSELFYGVLGGLGHFGIITRARIVLDKAPKRVKWVRMLYDNFLDFTRDQEHLISINNGLDYVEGSLILGQNPINNWRSSFFTKDDQSQINSVFNKHNLIYCLEAVKYYDDLTIHTIDEDLQVMFQAMNFVKGFSFKKDVSYLDFLNRVRSGELKLQSKGLSDVPHPWLNLFVPKSRINEFNKGIFVDIISKNNTTTGPVLVYPTTRKMWDDRMSAAIPEEEIFYIVGFLNSSSEENGLKTLEEQNEEVLKFCGENRIKIKQYLPNYTTKEEWKGHFGNKWEKFQERKDLFDPRMILSPGQQIF